MSEKSTSDDSLVDETKPTTSSIDTSTKKIAAKNDSSDDGRKGNVTNGFVNELSKETSVKNVSTLQQSVFLKTKILQSKNTTNIHELALETMYQSIEDAKTDKDACSAISPLVKYFTVHETFILDYLQSKIAISKVSMNQYPYHLAARKGYKRTMKLLFKLKVLSSLSNNLVDPDDLTPVESLIWCMNHNKKLDMEKRKQILVLMLINGGLTFNRRNKAGKNIFCRMREAGKDAEIHGCVEVLLQRLLIGGEGSIMPRTMQIQRACIERVNYLMNEKKLAKSFSSGRWIFYENFQTI